MNLGSPSGYLVIPQVMQLFVNNQEVYLEEKFKPNMTLQWIDTYNPSAVKSSYSKTVKIPACKANALIFTETPQEDYTFTIWNNGEVLQEGYLVIDSISEEKGKKYYNCTLYGELTRFFHTLKGDEESPKTLADLWYRFDGYDEESEKGKICPWNPETVYTSWATAHLKNLIYPSQITPSVPYGDLFVAVPAQVEGNPLDSKKTLFAIQGPGTTGSLYPSKSFDGSGSAWRDPEGNKCLVLEHEESNYLDRADFRTDLMPIGISLDKVVQACMDPINNGGYTVIDESSIGSSLLPLYFLVKQPEKQYNSDASYVSQALTWSVAPLIRSGEFLDSSDLHAVYDVVPGWINTVDHFLEATGSVTQTKINIKGKFLFQADQGYIQNNDDYLDMGGINVKLEVLDGNGAVQYTINNPLGGYGRLEKVQGAGNIYRINYQVPGLSYGDLGYESSTDCDFTQTIPGSLTKIAIRVTLSNSFRALNIYHLPTGEVVGQGDSLTLILAEGEILSNTSADSQFVYDSEYSIKDLVKDLNTPYDYLTWVTKLYNIRFFLDESRKTITLVRGKNWWTGETEDLTGRIDYDKEFKRIPRIIDEKYLRFGIDYDKNKYLEGQGVDKDLFSYTITTNNSRYNHSTKNYFDGVGFKIGCHALSSLLDPKGYTRLDYPIVNQLEELKMDYIQGDPYFDGSTVKDTYTSSFNAGRGYLGNVLTLKNVNNDLVYYSSLPKDYTLPGQATNYVISTTSQDMVVFTGGKPCFLHGFGNWSETALLNCLRKKINRNSSEEYIPDFCPGGTYGRDSNYSNLPVFSYPGNSSPSAHYNTYFKAFIDSLYKDPEQVECYVSFPEKPNFRKLFWFENQYWALIKVENYNYDSEPVKCTFVKYTKQS